MNLSRDQKIQVIAVLTEGMSIRSVERLTGIHRDTIMPWARVSALAARPSMTARCTRSASAA